MGIALIGLGLFLWFALAFNGGVGESFVNYSFFLSALLMIVLGVLKIFSTKVGLFKILCFVAVVAYIPMIWQRFNFSFGVDWGGFVIDVAIIAFMLVVFFSKPNKSLNQDTR